MLQAKFPNMRLLVQVVELDIRSERNEAGHCLDHLSLVENLGTNSSSVVSDLVQLRREE